jgi:hypothetical protein
VHRHFFNGSALAPGRRERFLRRRDEKPRRGRRVRCWGDAKRATPLTRDDWVNAINTVLNDFSAGALGSRPEPTSRHAAFTQCDCPSFSQHGGAVPVGFGSRSGPAVRHTTRWTAVIRAFVAAQRPPRRALRRSR